jgi:hypothetical protein
MDSKQQKKHKMKTKTLYYLIPLLIGIIIGLNLRYLGI